MLEYDKDNRLVAVGDKLYRKLFITENEGSIPESIWTDASNNANAADELKEIFGDPAPFDTPKPLPLLAKIIRIGTDEDSIVVDFFAGSGTSGHAVMLENALDGGSRRVVLIQLPDALDPGNKDQRVATEFCDKINKPRTIAEITKERLRRAGKRIKEENPLFAGDLGFRVFKLDSTNIREWDPDGTRIADSLQAHVEHMKQGRSEQDILFELLLKLGLDLCVPIVTKKVAGKEIHSIGGGVLITCLAWAVTQDDVEALAQGIVTWHKELKPAGESTIVFRDNAFSDDIAKTNLTSILNQNGLHNVRSL
jgi:adenine-specific DNA-methyltransferase